MEIKSPNFLARFARQKLTLFDSSFGVFSDFSIFIGVKLFTFSEFLLFFLKIFLKSVIFRIPKWEFPLRSGKKKHCLLLGLSLLA